MAKNIDKKHFGVSKHSVNGTLFVYTITENSPKMTRNKANTHFKNIEPGPN